MTRWLSGLAVAMLLGACAPPETRLTVETEVKPGDRIAVRGQTDLPDGAQLNVSLLGATAETPIDMALPVVRDASYAATLDPQADLPAGSYRVRVEFSPQSFAWSEHVKPAVGEKGEKLGGPHVKTTEDGWRVLLIDREVMLP